MCKRRCAWVTEDPLYQQYHDQEWGQPVYEDLKLFEFLILEGQQAGLSWITILKRRQGYRAAYCQFNPEKIARFNQQDYDRLMQNTGIIRNRRKVAAVIQNAKAYLRCAEQGRSFSQLLWQVVDGNPVINHWSQAEEVPVMTEQSKQMSSQLKKCGFTFVGPTICYAFMQAVGMVWDHTQDCFLSRASA